MADQQRIRRLGEYIQREVAQIIQREVKDPRVKSLNISAVQVNRDLSLARVYYTLLSLQGDQQQLQQQAQAGLEKASGFIRYLLGKDMKIRSVPKLLFIYDQSTQYGNYMSELIDTVIKKDQQKGSSNHLDHVVADSVNESK